MTKKDYVKLASAIKELTQPYEDRVSVNQVSVFIRQIMPVLSADNARFDRARFWKACGLPGEEL